MTMECVPSVSRLERASSPGWSGTGTWMWRTISVWATSALCARYFKKQSVFPHCIQLTLLHDKELYQLTRGAIVPQGGVKPFIHPVLMSTVHGKAEEKTVSEPPTAHPREDWYGESAA